MSDGGRGPQSDHGDFAPTLDAATPDVEAMLPWRDEVDEEYSEGSARGTLP